MGKAVLGKGGTQAEVYSTGKGNLIRQGVSLAGPITNVNAEKDPSRDLHTEAMRDLLKEARYDSMGKLIVKESSLFDDVKLKRATTNERQRKEGSDLDVPKMRKSRSKDSGPSLQKNATRSRSSSPGGPIFPKKYSRSRSPAPKPRMKKVNVEENRKSSFEAKKEVTKAKRLDLKSLRR